MTRSYGWLALVFLLQACGGETGDSVCEELECEDWEVCNPDTGACELAAGRCATDADCGSGYACNEDNTCVQALECFTNADCTDPAFPVCTNGACVAEEQPNACEELECEDWEVCNHDTEACELAAGRCATDADCGSGYTCDEDNYCVFDAECTTDADCPGSGTPVCSAGMCVAECTSSAECTDPSFPVCSLGRCEAETLSCGTGEPLRVVETSFSEFVDDWPVAAEDSEDYLVPSAAFLTAFEDAVDDLIAGDMCAAQENAYQADMEVVKIVDLDMDFSREYTNEYYCIIGKVEPNDSPDDPDPSVYRGIYCVRNYLESHTYSRVVHVSAPHPLNDKYTPAEAVAVFQLADARYLSLSTTHRRANAALSTCDNSYRESDMAHNIDSLYHAFTRRVHDQDWMVYHIQLHGYVPEANDVAITSIGTEGNYASTRPIRVFTDHLSDEVEAYALANGDDTAPIVASCNASADDDIQRLCATSNMQGRYINGSTIDTCNVSPTSFVNSRFIHVEQSAWLRGWHLSDPGADDYIVPKWDLVAAAVANTWEEVLIP